MSTFSLEEVRGLLRQHADDTGQEFPEEAVLKLYECSGSQPWLTNALANEIVAKMLGNDYSRPISADMVETAKERLVEQRQTHLDSLADKLREERVRRVVHEVDGKQVVLLGM